MKKIIWVLVIGILFYNCSNEPVEDSILTKSVEECCTFASIVVNQDYPTTKPGYSYEGDLTEWFTLREWSDGEGFIVTLESCDHQEYLGKYIIVMID